MLRTQLDALIHAHDTDSKAQPLPHRRGLAFAEWVERCPVDRLPATGGVNCASEARRLACRAGIIPTVLDGTSQVLDLGRKRRLHTGPQRIAMALCDCRCTAAGCDRPPSQCHAHHDTPWSKGGHTSRTNGRLLCLSHHRRIHDPAYHHTLRPDGRVTFHRRT